MICLDNTLLGILLFGESVKPPTDPEGNAISRFEDRLEFLLETWATDKEQIIIPTPVLAEFLVLAGPDASTYLDEIHATSHFKIESFDEKAAIEWAAMRLANRATLSKAGLKRDDGETKAKINFDRQIVAIAKANGATVIYSDDKGVATFAEQNGIQVIQSWKIPLPPSIKVELPFPNDDVTDERETIGLIPTVAAGTSGEPITDETGGGNASRGVTEDSDEEAAEKPRAASEDGV